MEIKKIEFQKQEQAKPNPNESNEQSKAQKSGVDNKKKPKKTKKKSKHEAKNNIKESTKKDSIPTEKDYIKQTRLIEKAIIKTFPIDQAHTLLKACILQSISID